MLGLHTAIVYKQLPERAGVLVVYRDGSYALDVGGPDNPVFVRVLQRRAHNLWGSENELPRAGEFGLVAELDGGFGVWLGSFPWQDMNQVDPEPRQASRRWDNGTLSRARANGDHEWLHGSGLRVTVSADGAPLPIPPRKGPGPDYTKPTPGVQIDHPTVGNIKLGADGTLKIAHKSGGAIQIDATGNLTLQGFASTAFEGGVAQFVMKALFDWVQTHTHSGVTAGAAATGPPSAAPPANSLSPATFKGPTA